MNTSIVDYPNELEQLYYDIQKYCKDLPSAVLAFRY